jgi:hypothetical protein
MLSILEKVKTKLEDKLLKDKLLEDKLLEDKLLEDKLLEDKLLEDKLEIKLDKFQLTVISIQNNLKQLKSNIEKAHPYVEDIVSDYNILFDDYKYYIDSSDSDQNELIHYIVEQIINKASSGKISTRIDLQYSNPQKKWYSPGRPKVIPNSRTTRWFTSRGFKLIPIAQCFNISSTCEFYCNGDGIGELLIKWSNCNSINVLTRGNFNSKRCNQLSTLVNEYNILQKINNI